MKEKIVTWLSLFSKPACTAIDDLKKEVAALKVQLAACKRGGGHASEVEVGVVEDDGRTPRTPPTKRRSSYFGSPAELSAEEAQYIGGGAAAAAATAAAAGGGGGGGGSCDDDPTPANTAGKSPALNAGGGAQTAPGAVAAADHESAAVANSVQDEITLDVVVTSAAGILVTPFTLHAGLDDTIDSLQLQASAMLAQNGCQDVAPERQILISNGRQLKPGQKKVYGRCDFC